jgi:uncharacterized protein YggU (UPF0235/DUF167 family)
MTYIKVRAITGAKKEELKEISTNNFEIRVREKAERNEANKKICQIINDHFDRPIGGVRIINGHHNPIKLLKVGNE